MEEKKDRGDVFSFFAYLWRRKKTIAVFCLFVLIFLVVFALYRLPLAAVGYPALLCLSIGLLGLIVDYIRTKRKLRFFARVRDVAEADIEKLPEDGSETAEQYRRLAMRLQSALIDAQAQAESRFLDMTEYYTIWAHQIKTPITAMHLTLQHEDTPLSRKLSSELFRIEQYVDMAMTYLRLDAQTGDYVFKEYRLDPILRQAISKFAAEFIDRRLTLTYEPTELTVVTDEKWLSFVVEQLLSNALKYTREGGITVGMPEKGVLCIADTGIGIAPDDLPRVFEKGYTGCNGRENRTASGIGLYLCKRVCSRLGIGIDLESNLECGTKVYLSFEVTKL